MSDLKNIVGMTFGRLTVVDRIARQFDVSTSTVYMVVSGRQWRD